MSGKRLSLILAAFGLGAMLTQWGSASEWIEAQVKGEQVRPKQVVYWTSSGSPEVDLKRARQFEESHPDINISPNFRETGGLQDILFLSFLSGNPPDYMDAEKSELRKYVLIGGIYPLDDLVARENERLKPQGISYTDQFLLGDSRLHRFSLNPDDRFLREMEKYPAEAARLLAMDGKIIGLRGVSMPPTITYNKRLFREAAKMFPDAGLVDDHGEPIPPTTWLEFYQKAKVITAYGRRAAEQRGLNEPICYGAVLQGQRPHDIVRGIKPLAYRAGSMAFEYSGSTEAVQKYFDPNTPEGKAALEKYGDQPVGFFNYENDAWLAAFALLWKLKTEGLILPGTAARHYEDVRTALASGEAAMVLDGWHAALIGAERVPWAAQDLGSAPVPTPYHEVDPNTGWTRQRVQEERQELYELLALHEVGIDLPTGNKMPRAAKDKIQFFTSLCRSPEATWEWIHYGALNPEVLKKECRRGTCPQQVIAYEHLGDPEWFPYSYQPQVYRIIEEDCAMWPDRPLRRPVQTQTYEEVFHKWFFQTEEKDLSAILRNTRQGLETYSEQLNRDLATRIEDGIVRPEEWSFASWDPTQAEKFYELQRRLSKSPEVKAKIEQVRRKFLKLAQENPGWGVLNEQDTHVRNDIWQYKPMTSSLQVLWIPALLVAIIIAWLVTTATRDFLAGRNVLEDTLRGARRNWFGYVFVLPGILAILAFAVYPSIYQFYLSAHSGDGLEPMAYVGMENFQRILNPSHQQFDKVFWVKVVPNTMLYMLVVTVGQICIGLLIASLLNLPLRANRAYRVLYFIPLVTSLAVVSVILIGLLRGEQSGVNQFLEWVGLEKLPYWLGLVDKPDQSLDWLGPKTGLWTVMLVGIWHGLPYNIILLLAGLQSISPQLYEAAKVDGANAWRRFIHVTIPEMLPILIIIAFNAFIGAARAFSVVFVLTEGGADHSSELVATYVFKKGFMKPEGQEADLGYASALGIVYSVMLAALTFTNVMIIARRWKRRLKAGQQKAVQPVKGGGVHG